MDDERIAEFYTIPDGEKTDQQIRVDIQVQDNGRAWMPCVDEKFAKRVYKILRPHSDRSWGSLRVYIPSRAVEWAVVQLEDEGLEVKYEAEGYEYGDNYPDNWNILRKAVYFRDNHTCQICSTRGRELHAHHVDHIEHGGGHNMENLIAVCDQCHEMHHGFEI